MERPKQIILWDFEGTLVNRPGRWRSALMEVLDMNEPEHQVETEQIRPFLRDGFPWHRPDEPHLNITTSKEYWFLLEQLFTRAYQGVGYNLNRAKELSALVRNAFTNPKRFILYEDTIPALEYLTEKGWKHAILSNHVPELPDIVAGIGLCPYINWCMSSGITGYEKPNPKAFYIALDKVGNPEKVWMVGDNPEADIQGAEAIGIPAILVRNQQHRNVKYHAPDLMGAVSIIESIEPNTSLVNR